MTDKIEAPHRENLQKRNRMLEPIVNGLTRMFNDFGY
jgi:hypothetical protein